MKYLLILFVPLLFACDVGFPNLAKNNESMKVVGDSLACSLSGFFGGHTEKISVSIPLEFLKKDFAPLVSGIAIKNSSVEAEKAITPTVKTQLEQYIEAARYKIDSAVLANMHSNVFYYKFLVRSLIHISNTKKIYANWRFSQVEYTKVSQKETRVIQYGINLEIVGGESFVKGDEKMNNNNVGFCDPL